jgi:hypothetical protein
VVEYVTPLLHAGDVLGSILTSMSATVGFFFFFFLNLFNRSQQMFQYVILVTRNSHFRETLIRSYTDIGKFYFSSTETYYGNFYRHLPILNTDKHTRD